MQNVKDDDGNKLNLQPDTIIIPNDPRIKAKVFEVLGADYKPGTGDNDSSYNYGRWNIIVWTFLGSPAGMTAGKSWFMIQDSEWNENYAGLVWIDRIDLTIKSEIDADTDANIWRGRGRYGAALPGRAGDEERPGRTPGSDAAREVHCGRPSRRSWVLGSLG